MACVVAQSTMKFPGALVIPDLEGLDVLANQLGLDGLSREELCTSNQVVQKVTDLLTEELKTKDMQRFEIPSAFTLVPHLWTPDTGLVTGAMKLRRKQIYQEYQTDIERMVRGW